MIDKIIIIMKKIFTKIQEKKTIPLILKKFQNLKLPYLSNKLKKRLIITLSSVSLITAYYFENYYKNENQFYFHSENPLNIEIESSIEEFKSKYNKTPFFFTRCLSIIYGNIIDDLELSYNREIIYNSKGENFALDWVDPKTQQKKKKKASSKNSSQKPLQTLHKPFKTAPNAQIRQSQ